MADVAWLALHAYDNEAAAVVETLIQEQDISRVHTFVPLQPDDWRLGVGISSEVHLVNGSVLYVTETFAALQEAVKAKLV